MIDPAVDGFLEVAAVALKDIEGAKVSLEAVIAAAPGGRSLRALALVATKLDEAELWLGAAVVEATKETV